MKFIFVFLALLHFHQLQVQSKPFNPIRPLIDRLRSLNEHSTINSTLSELQVPTSNMVEHTVCCVMKFKKITKEALNSVNVSAGHKHLIGEAKRLLAKLPSLEAHHDCTNAQEKCKTEPATTAELKRKPFAKHIEYLKHLNLNISN